MPDKTSLTVEIIASLKTFAPTLNKAARHVGDFAAKAGKHIVKLTKKVAKLGTAIAAAVASFAGLSARKAVREFAEVEKNVREIGTLFGRFSQEQVVEWTRLAQDLAQRYGQTTESILRGIYDIVSAGFTSTRDVTAIIEASLKAATAGLVDASTAVNLIISGLRAYGYEARDAMEVSDVLFTTVKYGRTTFGELAAYMGEVMPTARSAGVSLRQLGAALATITLGGIDTASAVTALNALIEAMVNPSDQAAEALQRLGIRTTDAAGRLMPLVDVVKQLRGRSLQELLEIAQERRAARALLALVNNFQTFEQILEGFQNTIYATDAAFASMADSLDMRRRQLRSTFTNLWQAIGEGLRRPAMAYYQDAIRFLDTLYLLALDRKADIEAAGNAFVEWVRDSVRRAWAAFQSFKPKTLDWITNILEYVIWWFAYALPKYIWRIAHLLFWVGSYIMKWAENEIKKLKLFIMETIHDIRMYLPRWMGGYPSHAEFIRALDDIKALRGEISHTTYKELPTLARGVRTWAGTVGEVYAESEKTLGSIMKKERWATWLDAIRGAITQAGKRMGERMFWGERPEALEPMGPEPVIERRPPQVSAREALHEQMRAVAQALQSFVVQEITDIPKQAAALRSLVQQAYKGVRAGVPELRPEDEGGGARLVVNVNAPAIDEGTIRRLADLLARTLNLRQVEFVQRLGKGRNARAVAVQGATP